LKPQLGVVRSDESEFVIADLPGLIEGASEGRGLGHRFLGHVERCGAILHLVDGTEDDVVASYRAIRGELEAYGNGLDGKPEIIGLNKVDALDAAAIKKKSAALARAAKKLSPGAQVLPLSGVAGTGVPEVLRALFKFVKKRRTADARKAAKDAEALA
jgi:GTP-binding protein